MRTIYKYPLVGYTTLTMPEGAQVIAFQEQRGQTCLWALVDTDRTSVTRTFRMVATGESIDDSDRLMYIGTLQLKGDDFFDLVYHLFEVL